MRQDPPNESLILDKFTHDDLKAWRRRANDLDNYNVQLFYHLQAQRQIHNDSLIAALKSSTHVSMNAEQWVRIVDFKYADNPLSPKGSLINGGRFNIGSDLEKFPSFPALYVGEDEATVRSERFGTPKIANGLQDHELALRKLPSFGFLNLKVNLGCVFDLTQIANLRAFSDIIRKFSTTKELRALARKLGQHATLVHNERELHKTFLHPEWRHYPTQYEIPANPQVFGNLVNAAKFAGVLYPSVRAVGKKCIAVFPQNFSDTDYVELSDAPHSGVKFKKMTVDNWEHITNWKPSAS